MSVKTLIKIKLRKNPVSACLKRYSKNADGSTAMEFAILAIPFSGLLFAILETAIVFFISSTMTNAVSNASRQIRTGQFQAVCADNEQTFKNLVCSNMGQLGNCQQRLRVDVVKLTNGNFDLSALPTTPPENTADPNQETPIPGSTYTSSAGEEIVIVRAQYFHKLVLPGWMTMLPNRNGNVRLLQSTTAFKNEPFPGTC